MLRWLLFSTLFCSSKLLYHYPIHIGYWNWSRIQDDVGWDKTFFSVQFYLYGHKIFLSLEYPTGKVVELFWVWYKYSMLVSQSSNVAMSESNILTSYSLLWVYAYFTLFLHLSTSCSFLILLQYKILFSLIFVTIYSRQQYSLTNINFKTVFSFSNIFCFLYLHFIYSVCVTSVLIVLKFQVPF